jgi:hypothetical protein
LPVLVPDAPRMNSSPVFVSATTVEEPALRICLFWPTLAGLPGVNDVWLTCTRKPVIGSYIVVGVPVVG